MAVIDRLKSAWDKWTSEESEEPIPMTELRSALRYFRLRKDIRDIAKADYEELEQLYQDEQEACIRLLQSQHIDSIKVDGSTYALSNRPYSKVTDLRAFVAWTIEKVLFRPSETSEDEVTATFRFGRVEDKGDVELTNGIMKIQVWQAILNECVRQLGDGETIPGVVTTNTPSISVRRFK